MAGQRDVQLVNEDFPSAESTDPGSQDHWLDEVTEPSNPVFNPATQFALSTFAGPARIIRRIWNFMTTTPGRMFAITVALSLAIAAAGVSMSNSSAERQGDLDRLLTVTEPTANAAHNLYTSLSLADTVASKIGRAMSKERSDVTYVHTAIRQLTGLITFHGLMVASDIGNHQLDDL